MQTHKATITIELDVTDFINENELTISEATKRLQMITYSFAVDEFDTFKNIAISIDTKPNTLGINSDMVTEKKQTYKQLHQSLNNQPK
jgi:hypothetical protein